MGYTNDELTVLVQYVHQQVNSEKGCCSIWMPMTDVASYLNLSMLDLREVKTVLRRKSVKEAFAKKSVAYSVRGPYMYAYTTDTAYLMATQQAANEAAEQAQKEAVMAKAAGQITLIPGVIASVASKSEAGKTHDVRLAKSGLVYCDCEGFRWRGHCAHIDEVILQNPAVKMMVKAGLREKISHLEEVIKGLDSDKE